MRVQLAADVQAHLDDLVLLRGPEGVDALDHALGCRSVELRRDDGQATLVGGAAALARLEKLDAVVVADAFFLVRGDGFARVFSRTEALDEETRKRRTRQQGRAREGPMLFNVDVGSKRDCPKLTLG